MIKRIFCVIATVLTILALGAGLEPLRESGVSLVAEDSPAISFGRGLE